MRYLILFFLLTACAPKINSENKDVVAPPATPAPEVPTDDTPLPEAPPVNEPEKPPVVPPVETPQPPQIPAARVCNVPVWWDLRHPAGQFYVLQVSGPQTYLELQLPLWVTSYNFQSTVPGNYCFAVTLAGPYGPLYRTPVFCGYCDVTKKD